MISETFFARSFTSFWQGMLPYGDALVRRLNTQYVVPYTPPAASIIHPRRRALVNAIAFERFRHQAHKGKEVSEVEEFAMDEFVRVRIQSLNSPEEVPVSEPTPAERSEARLLGQRLSTFFFEQEKGAKLTVSPVFPGSGILDSCRGDVVAGGTIYHVKTGDRAFRITDLRQTLVYCALNSESRQHSLSRVCLVNPQRGRFAKLSLEGVCREACGRSSAELFGTMIEFLSSRGASH